MDRFRTPILAINFGHRPGIFLLYEQKTIQLRATAANALSLDASKLSCVFNGEVLPDEATVAAAGVAHEATVRLQPRGK